MRICTWNLWLTQLKTERIYLKESAEEKVVTSMLGSKMDFSFEEQADKFQSGRRIQKKQQLGKDFVPAVGLVCFRQMG